MCICRCCCLVTIFGSSAKISFKAREGERWLGDAAAVGSREHQCMLLANCSLTAPKRRLAGWQAGGVSYPQIVIIIYKKQLQKKKKTLYLKMNGKIKKIVRYESQTSVVQVTLERRQVHRICILIRFVCTLINVVLLRSKTHLYLLTVPTVYKDRCLTS